MKRIIIFGILAFSFFSLLSDKAIAKEKRNEKTLTFDVNMDCHSCVQKIESNIPYEKGVKDLKVSLDNKTCEVTYRVDKTTPGALIKAFEKIGYKAEIKKGKYEDRVEKPDSSNIGHIH